MRLIERLHKILKAAVMPAAAAALIIAILWTLGAVTRPSKRTALGVHTPREIAEAKSLRDIKLDTKHPPVVYRAVNYGEGRSGTWYPKNEAPILNDLVKEGKLPPVAERVGSEPLVLEGVEGVGQYGGTFVRLGNSLSDIKGVHDTRFSCPTLVRWSPIGYPIVPHIAKSWTISPDNRVFTFTLRKGMRWSDGTPYTADDILYWWEKEINDAGVNPAKNIPDIMKAGRDAGTVKKIDAYTVQFIFPRPNGIFLSLLGGPAGIPLSGSPRHYMQQFHPSLGDQELIKKVIAAKRVGSKTTAYFAMKDTLNPDFPVLTPWIYRTYKSNPPQIYVRNPYFFAVDTKGNQLPYIDRMLYEVKDTKMISIASANGEATMQDRHISFEDYTHLMSSRASGGYELYHWYNADSSVYLIYPNINRRIDPARPETKYKHDLLADKRFRQALSLAIDRVKIIKTLYNGYGEPAQCAPRPESFFYEPAAFKSYTEFQPDRANRMLDELGLAKRDAEGYRTFSDGMRMTFFLEVPLVENFSQLVVNEWAKIGIRVIFRTRSRTIHNIEQMTLEHDFDVWWSNNEYIPVMAPRFCVPHSDQAFYAIGFSRWYKLGGLYGDPKAKQSPGAIEPAADHPLRRALEIFERTKEESDIVKQRAVFREAIMLAAENVWTINISTPPPLLAVVKKGLRNVPRTVVCTWEFLTPVNTGVETYYFDKPDNSPGAIAQMKREIIEPTQPPDAVSSAVMAASTVAKPAAKKKSLLGGFIQAAILITILLCIILISVRHPYIGKRLLIMIPTLLIISVVVFWIIQLPPGDFISSRIAQLEMSGEKVDQDQVTQLRKMFNLDDPVPVQYIKWLGLPWFVTFKPADAGLLQGNMGRSMQNQKPVNDLVGDRILLTILISLGTILLTWALAIPIGIFSAVKQYSVADYVLSFIGFIGMCVPSFLLALLVIYASDAWFGVKVSGLFSTEFAVRPEWSWGKVIDLLKHIWVPIVVLGVEGTAGMIRVMRGNLLDELKKPYVTTARAKGVRPLQLLLKYPVRLALNPFISNIGHIFPALVSGSAIVAIVLSLPTVGPLMLESLMNEDMYLAGSMLMVLSLLGVIGTLVSDVLLLALDPRIRYGGSR
ncbi:MAG: ABC transporter permease subunit [Spirochaetes bacterium]|nr:ABC transporter permease subunit [Spirochaetota bacterium]